MLYLTLEALLFILPISWFSYEVQLVPDLKTFIFQGTCKIKFSIDPSKLDDTNKNVISLHSKELCISSAQYVVLESTDEITTTPVSACEILLNVKATTVEFRFEKDIPANAKTIQLTINYIGYLNNQNGWILSFRIYQHGRREKNDGIDAI